MLNHIQNQNSDTVQILIFLGPDPHLLKKSSSYKNPQQQQPSNFLAIKMI
jgi:hypothetical protein